MEAYAPATRKNIFKTPKKSIQKFSVYTSTFYLRTSSFAVNQHFYVFRKKTKKISYKVLFSTKICPFHI
jgi:hypothetical protein